MNPDPKNEKSLAAVPVGNVPTFTCIVYVRKTEGGVEGRVANMEMPLVQAADERAVLQKIVPAFKKAVADLTAEQKDIPWLDPIREMDEGEQKRLIPVHL